MTHTLTTNRFRPQAQKWLALKALFDVVKGDLDGAKADLVSIMSPEDGPHVVVVTPDGNVAVTDKDRRTFDADLLAKLGNSDILVSLGVLKLAVNPSEFDLAVRSGLIDAKIVSKVVKTTPYVDVRQS